MYNYLETKMTNLTEEQTRNLIIKLGMKWTEVKDKEITIPNDFSTGKLYVFCKYEMKDQAYPLGLRFDKDMKLWYIPKSLSQENVKKLLALEIKLSQG